MIDETKYVDPEITKTWLSLGAERVVLDFCFDCNTVSNHLWVDEHLSVLGAWCDACGHLWRAKANT